MPNINWENLENDYNKFKNYASEGTYTVKCDGVEIKEVGANGSVVMKFHFEDTDVQYPTADHWLSFKNDNWRQWHNRCLMIVLGASEDAAKKAVETCEGKDDKEAITKAYEMMYKKLLAKKPTVKIDVFQDGKYTRADFNDRSVAMPRDNEQPKKSADPMDGAEDFTDEELSAADIPF